MDTKVDIRDIKEGIKEGIREDMLTKELMVNKEWLTQLVAILVSILLTKVDKEDLIKEEEEEAAIQVEEEEVAREWLEEISMAHKNIRLNSLLWSLST